jgi:hypothetical protein
MFAPQAKLHVQTVRMRLRTSELQPRLQPWLQLPIARDPLVLHAVIRL